LIHLIDDEYCLPLPGDKNLPLRSEDVLDSPAPG
jgi:hypothetical protein